MDFSNRKDFLVGRLPFNDDRDSLDSCSLDSYMDSDASSLGHSPSFHESGRLIPESAYTELTDSTLTLTPQSARWRPPTGFSPTSPPPMYYHPGQYHGKHCRNVMGVKGQKGTKPHGIPGRGYQQTCYGRQYVEVRHVDRYGHEYKSTKLPAIHTKLASVYGIPQTVETRRCATVVHKNTGQRKAGPKQESIGVTLPPIHTAHAQSQCRKKQNKATEKTASVQAKATSGTIRTDLDVLQTRAMAPPFNTYVDEAASARFVRHYYGEHR